MGVVRFPQFLSATARGAPRLSDRFSDVENILGSKISGSEYLLYFCQYTTVFFNPQYPQKQSMGHIDFLHADRHQRNKEIEILAKFIAELLEDVVNLVVLKIVQKYKLGNYYQIRIGFKRSVNQIRCKTLRSALILEVVNRSFFACGGKHKEQTYEMVRYVQACLNSSNISREVSRLFD